MIHPRSVAAFIVVGVALAACGDGGDDATPAPTTAVAASDVAAPPTAPDSSSTQPASGTDGELPVPTFSPDVPEQFLGAIGPVATVGEPLPPLSDDAVDPAVGRPAPILVGENFDGDRMVVDPSKDGSTWVIFLAHWCPHCNDEIPVINELRDDGRIPDGVRIVGVSTAVDPGRPNFPPGEWLVDKDWTFEVLVDGIDFAEGNLVAATAYGVSGFPFSVLVDDQGVVTARWSGGRDSDELISLLVNNLPLG